MELFDGFVRLQSANLVKPDSSFETRTNDCVVGALGRSDFFIESRNLAVTLVTVLSGQVAVRDSNPNHKTFIVKAGLQFSCNETSPPKPYPAEFTDKFKDRFLEGR